MAFWSLRTPESIFNPTTTHFYYRGYAPVVCFLTGEVLAQIQDFTFFAAAYRTTSGMSTRPFIRRMSFWGDQPASTSTYSKPDCAAKSASRSEERRVGK